MICSCKMLLFSVISTILFCVFSVAFTLNSAAAVMSSSRIVALQRVKASFSEVADTRGSLDNWLEDAMGRRWFSVRSVGVAEPLRMAEGVESLLAVMRHIEGTCELLSLVVALRLRSKPSEAGQVHNSRVVVKYVSIPPLNGDLPRGFLLLFHGCSHSAKDFCFAGSRCPGCLGLPEELRFVAAGLRAGLHVIAISAANTRSGCWTSARRAAKVAVDSVTNESIYWNSVDHAGVLHVLRAVGVLDSVLPIIAMGASSGGAFAASLPALLGERLIGVAVQISASRLVWRNEEVHEGSSDTRSLRVIYSVMQRDAGTTMAARALARGIAAQRGSLLDHAATSKVVWVAPEVGVAFFSKAPTPVIGSAFSERIPFFPKNVSQELVDALLAAGVADEKSLLLLADPRRTISKWTAALRPIIMERAAKTIGLAPSSIRALADSLKPDKSGISEVLNVLYANHEFFADHAESMISFLLG
jgi:hypothetical protein